MDINATMIGQSIAFIFFVVFCMRYVWPPINAAIEERQKKIEDGLAASERAEKDLELAQEKAKDQIKQAKQDAAELIEQAKKRASQIVDEDTQRGREEREKIIAQGHIEIEAERNRVREELRGQVASLAIAGAEKILQRHLDADAHNDIIETLVSEL